MPFSVFSGINLYRKFGGERADKTAGHQVIPIKIGIRHQIGSGNGSIGSLLIQEVDDIRGQSDVVIEAIVYSPRMFPSGD